MSKRITVNFTDAEFAALQKSRPKDVSLSSHTRNLIAAALDAEKTSTSVNTEAESNIELKKIRIEIEAIKAHKEYLEEMNKNLKLIHQLSTQASINNLSKEMKSFIKTQQAWFEEFEEFLKGKKFKIKKR